MLFEFRLDEHFRKSGMGHVVGLARQRQFAVGRQLQFPRARAMVGQRNATDLGIVLWRNRNLENRRDRAIAAYDFGPIFSKIGDIAFRSCDGRLIAGRPDVAARNVSHKAKAAPIIACHILAPTRDRDLAPTRVAGAGSSHHRGEPAVRQKLRSG